MHKYKAQVGQQSFTFSESDINELNIVERNGVFHLLENNQNHEIELLSQNGKSLIIKVNNTVHSVNISDEVDQMVAQMGMDKPAEVKMTDVKAPMPGLILDIMVGPGTEVTAGDPLLILEAMKMENVLKAVGDGVVKSVEKAKGETVEKSEIILIME